MWVARTKLGIRQHDLAERVGVSPTSISQWERGHHAPSSAMVRRLSIALRVSVIKLGKEPSSKAELVLLGSRRHG